jgi:hypothetical protein
MAGRGPAPKPGDRRARRNVDPIGSTVLKFRQVEPPEVPEDWHPRTIAWWDMWRNSPQADTFVESDWLFLLDTALMHHQLWENGDTKLAAEIRLRVAKFGATPEDRARLRMVFADADEKDEKRARQPSAARERRGGLTAV